MPLKDKFRKVFQTVELAMVILDARCIVSDCNMKALKLLSLDQVCIGRKLSSISPALARQVKECIAKRTSLSDFPLPRESGDLEVDIFIATENQTVSGAICLFRSLTKDTRPPHESYEILNQQFETIFQSSSDGIWVCDGQGIVIKVNKASEELNGIRTQDVVGRRITELETGKVFDQSVTTRVMATRQRQTVMQHISKTNKDLLSTGVPSFDAKGDIALIVVNERDITELNVLRKQIEQSQIVDERIREELNDISFLELSRNDIIAESPSMRNILRMALRLSHIGASNILILGESGTGKGLLAKLIHKHSERSQHPFIEINCAALPESLLEAELFGYEKGAFTGASEKGKIGLFELAQGGTIFLDEIGDMPLSLQAKLLKYLDNHEIRRLGSTKSIQVRCSTIAATNKDLGQLVIKRTFREDLYYRLNSFLLRLPPLRERREDIAGLTRFYLGVFNTTYNCQKTISAQAMHSLLAYSFPGNIRELKNILENAVVMNSGDQITDLLLANTSGSLNQSGTTNSMQSGQNLNDQLLNLERDILSEAKKHCRTTRDLAKYLGISQSSVVRKYQQFKPS